jgi:hypothetical protein
MSRAGNTIFSLEDDGELVIMRAARDAMNVVKRYDLSDNETWAQPALSGDRIFVKDIAHLTLFTLR